MASGTPTTPGTPETPSTGTQTASERLASALAEASAAYEAGQSALKQGDFTAYGEAQKKLVAAIKRAQAAQADLG